MKLRTPALRPGSGRCAIALAAAFGLLLGAAQGRAEEGGQEREHHHHHEKHEHDHHAHHAAGAPEQAAVRRTTGVAITVPATTLVRDTGEKADIAAELDRDGPVYVNFIYTSCTSVCPVMSQIFAGLETTLLERKDPARLVSISIDPAYDTPERLAAYAKNFRAGSNWSFLTGSVDASVAVQKAFGVYKLDKMDHEVAAFYRASRNSPWVRLDGFATPDQLAAERDASPAAETAASGHVPPKP